jgi:hypothetical protein
MIPAVFEVTNHKRRDGQSGRMKLTQSRIGLSCEPAGQRAPALLMANLQIVEMLNL